MTRLASLVIALVAGLALLTVRIARGVQERGA